MTAPLLSLRDEAITVEISTQCNSACTHCFARAGRDRTFSLERQTLSSIINEAFSLGYRRLHLTGGEPFLHESLFSLIDEALGMGYEHVFINTNGTLLTDLTCASLAARGPGLSLSVSLQGPRDIHDAVRGPGSYDRALRGLENLANHSVKTALYTTAGRSLLPVLPFYTKDILQRFPFLAYLALIQVIRVTDDALDLSQEVLRPVDFLALVKTAALLNLGGCRVTILENPLAAVTAHILGMPWLPAEPPLHRPGRLTVMADGALTMAHSTRRSMGVYRPGLLEKILVSEEYAAAVASDRERCPECRHREACAAQGMVRPSERYRDMDEEIPYCVRVLDMAYACGDKYL